jgi:hypothetical protein
MNRSRKPVSFKNLSLGATDLDGIIEYHELCYVLFEFKFSGSPLPTGQRLALVRMCDDLQKVKPTLLIFAAHPDLPPDADIDAASAKVVRYRYKGTWYDGKDSTVKALTDRFLAKYGGFST